tara:strand:- start:490 stop:1629 length:1140 start_codon:yes stop_codon:yes gene_type:complete
MSKTYCAYPFTNLYVASDNKVSPCCNFLNPVYSNPLVDCFNEDWIKNIRSDMLKGKSIKGCETCYNKEAAGIESEREQANKEFGIVTDPKLLVLDLMLDNVCNLKCRMCNSGYSHNWGSDELLLYGRVLSDKKYTSNTIVDNQDFGQLKRIVFQGGEPLYSPKFEINLDKLNEQNTIENIELWLTTNATIMPSEKTKAYIQRFKTVAITVSLDGTDKLFEYIRKNADFEKVKKVLDYYHSIINDNIFITINHTVSVYNVNEVDRIQSYYQKHYPKFFFNENFVNYPAELNIQNTPEDFKKHIKSLIKNKRVLTYLNVDGENFFDYFVHYTTQLDNIRKESIKEANPWLHNYIEQYKSNKTLDDAKDFWNKFIKMFTEEL